MKKMTQKTKTRLKIVGATATTIFSLFSLFTATLAWFSYNDGATASGMSVMAKSSGGVTIKQTKIIKFDYDTMEFGTKVLPDYINPEKGEVHGYVYDPARDGGTFCYYDETKAKWITTSGMNPYDPIEKGIKGTAFNLSSLNCNAVYAVTFDSPDNDYLLRISSVKKDGVNTPNANNKEIALSTCVDFDVFFEEDYQKYSSTYISNTNYAVGSIVIYNNNFYECIDTGNAEYAPDNATYGEDYWKQINGFDIDVGYKQNDLVVVDNSIYKCNTNIGVAFSTSEPDNWAAVPTYSTSESTEYKVGNFVLYSGMVYRCIKAVNGSETTPNSDVTNWKSIAYTTGASYGVGEYAMNGANLYKCKNAIDSAPAEFDLDDWTVLNSTNSYSDSLTYRAGDFTYVNSVLYICKNGNREAFSLNHWDPLTTHSSSSTYAKNDIVLYNGVFYRCSIPVTTAGTFAETKTHWRALVYNDCYYPSYTALNNAQLNEEEIYYRTSYLASKSVHKHFYYDAENESDPGDAINIIDEETYYVHQSNNDFTIYINVNYAPEELNEYYSKITSQDVVYKALYDFVFKFEFLDVPAEQGGGE